MTPALLVYAVTVVAALVAGWVVPAIAIRALLPALQGGDQLVTNYRGRRIPTGLGLVWAIWAVGVGLVTWVSSFLAVWAQNALRLGTSQSVIQLSWSLYDSSHLVALTPWALVLGTCLFGVIDDVYGSGAAKGFRGHISALLHGRLTTGGLKMIGIGVLALVSTSGMTQLIRAGVPAQVRGWPELLLTWILSAMAIALSANLVNLTDLRPGRALKSYTILAVIALAIISTLEIGGKGVFFAVLATTKGWQSAFSLMALLFSLAVLVLGPVLAVWRLDLKERGMLGDAGANAMGALAGYLLVVESPLWLVAVIVVVLLALNLASERFSFTKVIEKVGFLRWIDGLGRSRPEPEAEEFSDR